MEIVWGGVITIFSDQGPADALVVFLLLGGGVLGVDVYFKGALIPLPPAQL